MGSKAWYPSTNNFVRRTMALFRKTIVEQRVAITTASPIRLCGFCFPTIVWQPEFVPLRFMRSAGGTDLAGSILSGKHHMALIAEVPIWSIVGHG
jgi:hypothetical protein